MSSLTVVPLLVSSLPVVGLLASSLTPVGLLMSSLTVVGLLVCQSRRSQPRGVSTRLVQTPTGDYIDFAPLAPWLRRWVSNATGLLR